ncbi:Pycsar system effector family protein [Ruminiclostridium cellobioparum]|uniref:Pycsar system effector family protein n=1 Tax=Ruminiclostridium cellobioparum TaxID=29355 RepID=UPI0028A9F8B6|nr:Pycsar system effector family protein [Ruminiclostridium cellobioparum]
MAKNTKVVEKEDLYQILERNISWIGNCDTKASVILGGIGIIVSIFLSSEYVIEIKKITDAMTSKGVSETAYIIFETIALLFIVVGLFYLVRVLLVRTNTKEFKERGLKSDSMIFFSSIARNKTFREYKVKIENCSESDIREDLISQIYVCSQICNMKFKNYKIGLILSIIGFVSFSILLFIGVMSI